MGKQNEKNGARNVKKKCQDVLNNVQKHGKMD